MKQEDVDAIALSIRSLTMDAVQKANSGHPGMPMGMAEFGALLYGSILRYDPEHVQWPNRDRFILSAGHGSLFLYALLHLAGFSLSLQDIQHFRQLGSNAPGHPEVGSGVEVTTGPLGQGIANAVGLAIAERYKAERFNTPEHAIVKHYVYVLAGDGCFMEGISAEASSLAGHLRLGSLILFYDSNHISIDGSTDITFTEDVAGRYRSYGWDVQQVSAYNTQTLLHAVKQAQNNRDIPSLIILDSVIAKGSSGKEGSSKAHGAALGVEEVEASKKALGLNPDEYFYIHPQAKEYFAHRRKELKKHYKDWLDTFLDWKQKNPGLYAEWQETHGTDITKILQSAALPQYQPGSTLSTRAASGECITALSRLLPNIIGGSADLAASNNTDIPGSGDFSAENPQGRNLRFGVREHAMAALCNGIILHGGLRPFCATFLVFSDYMRPAIRLSALMRLPVVYIFTHDSIYVGEDGPTHQPVEHLAALRAIPGLRVIRPADAEETAEAWRMAMEGTDPTCLILSRQSLPVYRKQKNWQKDMRNGAHIVRKAVAPKVVLIATGSEVSLSMETCEQWQRLQKESTLSAEDIQVVSMPCRERFLSLGTEERAAVVPPGVPAIIVEAGVAQGWEALGNTALCLKSFGLSGPGNAVAEFLGLSTEKLSELIVSLAI